MVNEAKVERLLWFLLFLYLALFPFGQLNRIPLPFLNFPEIRLYLTDMLAGIMGGVGFIWWVIKKKPAPSFSREMLFFAVAALFSLILASPLFTNRELAISGLYLLRLTVYGLFYCAVYHLARTRESQQLLFSSLILVGTVVALFGWIQYFAFPDIRPLTIFGWDEHYKRIVGTFLDPNFTALVLVLTLIMLSFHLIKKFKKSVVLIWLVVFSALLFTYSRSGYLAFLVGMGVFCFLRGKFRFLAVSAALLAVSAFFLPRPPSEGVKLERVASSFARLENWNEAFSLARSRPLFGWGFNTLRYTREQKGLLIERFGPSHASAGVDNSFLFVLTTTGVVGIILFSWLIFKIFYAFWERKNAMSIVVPATFMAILTHSLFTNSFFYPWVLGFLSILLAISAREKG